ncbi:MULTISPECIES: LysR family transcriptional regulator [unclassified Variovorax]|jgi:DNA-binding transcriptional LysR family regulator|uniref:LysR family transcriptional regulator n=1 Tax=unclassified Variovorax TaxID=663243 RepID=UPI000F7E2114|nr:MULTISPECIES: LysR family transcriptional regulator [unclassified Variovorax]RSZ45636.1 LysR family transcriptional regulator [Variovorax sp. 553]RSZ46909.1 LysR family transcriptional regulator [Variovorax sp. 679]
MELKDIDLNLLVVFQQLLVDRRVSKVAASLGLSQPGVSNALARLRKLTDDPLFLRTPNGMEPTPYAQQLAEPTARALQVIHAAINQKASFDPATSKRAFTVGMTDIGEIYFLPRLMKEIARVAPNVSLSTVRNTAVNLQDEMEAGHVNLAIGLLPQLKTGYFQRRLFKQNYVCVFRRGHPLDRKKGKVSLDEFSAAEHVVVISAGTGHGNADEFLDRKKVVRKVVLTVPHYVAVGHILHDSDLIATVPEKLAQALAGPFDLSYVRHPAKLPEIAINLFWHGRFQKDPAISWLRSLIVGLHGEGTQGSLR